MMMINIKELEQDEGKYYYKGELFSGVGFRTSDEKVEDLHRFKDGVSVSGYRCKYFSSEDNISQIDIDYIDFTGEFLNPYAFYENKKFSGIAYEFEKEQGFCLGQHLIEEGVPVVSFTWYPSGKNKSLSIDRKGFVQIFEWFENDSLKYFEIYSHEFRKRLIAISLTEENQLKTVWIEKDYFDWILNHGTELEFHYFENKDSFNSFTVDRIFSVIHSGVDDELFSIISSNGGLKELSEIIISRTSVGAKSLLDLAGVETLKKVAIRGENPNLLDAVKQLKRTRQDISIRLNEQEVTI
jgi:hypothetical protein